MRENEVLKASIRLLVVLGVIITCLGIFGASKVVWPPIITSIGFFVIAKAIDILRE